VRVLIFKNEINTCPSLLPATVNFQLIFDGTNVPDGPLTAVFSYGDVNVTETGLTAGVNNFNHSYDSTTQQGSYSVNVSVSNMVDEQVFSLTYNNVPSQVSQFCKMKTVSWFHDP
jgi:hypothetical protein